MRRRMMMMWWRSKIGVGLALLEEGVGVEELLHEVYRRTDRVEGRKGEGRRACRFEVQYHW
jgi:hypothetical protein